MAPYVRYYAILTGAESYDTITFMFDNDSVAAGNYDTSVVYSKGSAWADVFSMASTELTGMTTPTALDRYSVTMTGSQWGI